MNNYIGHSEIIGKYGDWQDAMRRVDEMGIPRDAGRESYTNTFHDFGFKKVHPLRSFILKLPDILAYEAELRYSYCQMCQKIWNKYIASFNNATNSCYQRWIVKGGKDRWEEEAAEIMGIEDGTQ